MKEACLQTGQGVSEEAGDEAGFGLLMSELAIGRRLDTASATATALLEFDLNHFCGPV